MGKASTERPKKLAKKLLDIRTQLDLSQNELIRAIGYEDEITQSQISAFERGSRVPSLLVLLSYAKLAKISTDILIDDSLKLPDKLTDK